MPNAATFDIVLSASGKLTDLTKCQEEVSNVLDAVKKLQGAMAETSRFTQFGEAASKTGGILKSFAENLHAAGIGSEQLEKTLKQVAAQASLFGEVGTAFGKLTDTLGKGGPTFANLGKALATPFGAAFVLAAGAIIISELERTAMERIARLDAISASADVKAAALRKRYDAATTDEQMAGIKADAAKELTAVQAERKKLADSLRAGRVQAEQKGNVEEQARRTALEAQIRYFTGIIETVDTRGSKDVATHKAAVAASQPPAEVKTDSDTAAAAPARPSAETVQLQEKVAELQTKLNDLEAARAADKEAQQKALDDTTAAFQARTDQQTADYKAQTETLRVENAKRVKDVADSFKKTEPALSAFQTAVNDMWKNVASQASRSLTDLVLTGKASFGELARSAIRSLTEIVVQLGVINPLMNGAMKAFGATSWTPLATLFGTPLAAGGPVDTGKIHLVGEEGPELFIPRTAGSILPAPATAAALAGPAAGASTTVAGDTYFIDASNADAAGLARLEGMIRALNGSIEHRALSANFEAKRRRIGSFR